MTPILVTSQEDLQRIVDASVEAATSRLLARLPREESRQKAWLTNREAMAYLGLSKTTLQRYRTSGSLPYAKIGGNIFYRYEDLAAVLEAHLVTDPDPA